MSIKQSIDSTDFLANIWQKKPFFIKQGYKHDDFPLSVDDMAGLACEEEVESRLVTNIATENGANTYTLTQGPFPEETLRQLGDSGWSLLIQALDHWSEEVFQLLEGVDFLPYWRTDDIMVSISASGGSVGPHFDFYDVFLIQLHGNKTWRIGQTVTSNNEIDHSSGLKLLKDFNEQQCIQTQPGDVLYLPPQVAHWGVADEASDTLCVTLSIGFRAPSHREIIDDFAAQMCESLDETQRFIDPSPCYTSPGKIPETVVAQLRSIVEEHLLSNPEHLLQWFGKYMTLPRAEYRIDDAQAPATFCDKHKVLYRAPGARLAYCQVETTAPIDFFINGEYMSLKPVDSALVRYLCDNLRYEVVHLHSLACSTSARKLLNDLLRQKVLIAPLDNHIL